MFTFSCFSCGANKNNPANSVPEPHSLSEKISKNQDNSSSSAYSSSFEFDMLNDARDGRKYKTVAIGTQIWIAENLSYDAKNSKCYNNEPANCNKYGRLYSWETVSGNQNICPKGWRLPNNAEWNILVNYLGGEKNAGTKLKAKNGWNNFEKASGNGTDDYGFAALPGGHGSREGKFSYAGDLGLWWSDNQKAHSEFASNWYINTRGNAKNNDYFEAYESFFCSIRCIKKD
jgi:uncharacterized protein (TIGR02145 family)